MTRSNLDSRWRDPEQPEREGRDRFHVAINMDGNGRWALLRGQPREAGHVAGAAAVRRTVESAPALGITTLTLYAFSSDNWRRPRGEVDNLMFLFEKYLDSECARLTDSGVRFNVIGRRDRIADSLRDSIERVEERTSEGTSLHLRVAMDYSARDALLAAAGRVAQETLPTRQAFERYLCEAIHAPIGTRDVDLLIRTGGEQRLSDFLLWESAYAELYFTDVLWPEFTGADLATAVQVFAARDRRYGGILGPAPWPRRRARSRSTMRRFLVCIHDATPAYARETREMIRDLAPILGRRLSFGVVPNWHGEWPLSAHPDYCRLVRECSEELLLHGYCHQRLRGWGPTTLLTAAGDEMNGLELEETRRTLERGQRVFTEVFGEPARGFLAPAWQPGHMRLQKGNAVGLDHVLGFFSLESRAGRKVPLATWSWDCGRWGWLGHLGHRIGWLSQSLDRGVPTLAIHPRDLERGFWPKILRLTQELVETGYEPSIPAGLLEASDAEVDT